MIEYSTSSYKYFIVNIICTSRLYENQDYTDALRNNLEANNIEPVFGYFKQYYNDDIDDLRDYKVITFDNDMQTLQFHLRYLIPKLIEDGISLNNIIVFKKSNRSYIHIDDLITIYVALRRVNFCTVHGIEDIKFSEDYVHVNMYTDI